MQKHRHNKYILLAALERCCDSFLDVEKAFSVTRLISAIITKITDGSFIYGNTILNSANSKYMIN